MAWTTAFKRSLNDPSVTVEYSLRFYRLPWALQNSSNSLVEVGRLAIGEQDIEITGVSIVPQSWGVTFGGFTIQLVGDLRPINASALRKGNVASLYMSRNRQRPERICIGQLRSISGVRNVWTLQFVDVLSMLYARVTNQQSKQPFYYQAGRETTATAAFNFASAPELYVADISTFEKDSTHNGMIKIVDTTHSAEDYWEYSTITPTSGSAGYLTIISIGNWPTTGSHGHLHSGDVVINLARTKGRPDKILHRTLISINGDDTESSYDDYPNSYAVNVKWGSPIWDTADANYWYETVLKPSSSVDLLLDILHEEPSTEGIRVLTDNYALLGMWPVWVQDSMSIRSCQDLKTANNVALRISDRDIIEILSHEIYSQNQSVVYVKHTYTYRTASGSGSKSVTYNNPDALPNAEEIIRDVTAVTERSSDTGTMVNSALQRLKPYDFRTYEELVLQVTEQAAILAAGDIVMITSDLIYGYSENQGKTYRARKGMVTGLIWRPRTRSVILTIAVGIVE